MSFTEAEKKVVKQAYDQQGLPAVPESLRSYIDMMVDNDIDGDRASADDETDQAENRSQPTVFRSFHVNQSHRCTLWRSIPSKRSSSKMGTADRRLPIALYRGDGGQPLIHPEA